MTHKTADCGKQIDSLFPVKLRPNAQALTQF
jgi:hypothetical protein